MADHRGDDTDEGCLGRMKTVLTIAGSDSSGGAGIQADLRAIESLGCRGISAITAVTAQSMERVYGLYPLTPDALQSQLSAAEEEGIDGAKLGMLATAELVEVVADFLQRRSDLPLVSDPVMAASSGHPLLDAAGTQLLVQRVLPLTDVLCPNAVEAGILLNRSISTLPEARRAVRELADLGPRSVVLKGGHLQTDEVVDLLWDGESLHEFSGPRIPGQGVRGTGCVHASTLASLLTQGRGLVAAVSETAERLRECIVSSRERQISYLFPGHR
jgi:hydroxymethylpyrimidine/phosphomethylpyrimidine kinase